MGVVLIEVASGYDTRNILSDVKSRVDAIDNFAEETEKPIIEELLLKSQILSVAVSADTDEKTLRKLAERVRDKLIQADGITQAELSGVRDYEIAIEVSEWTLREYGISLDEVANAVRASSLESARRVGPHGGGGDVDPRHQQALHGGRIRGHPGHHPARRGRSSSSGRSRPSSTGSRRSTFSPVRRPLRHPGQCFPRGPGGYDQGRGRG